MAEPGLEPQHVPASNPPPAPTGQQAQQQQQQQDHVSPPAQAPTAQQPGQQVVHLIWSILSQNFQENLMRMQKHIYSAPIIGWMHIIVLKVSKSKDFV